MPLRPYQLACIEQARAAVRALSIAYALVDPRDTEVRYIGKTVRGVQRILEHTQGSALEREDTWKARWVKSLLRLGLVPRLQVLAELNEGEIDACEIAWIAFARAEGWPLTNLTDGGEGALHPAPDVVERRRASMIGRKLSDETKAKISAANKAAHARPETRERMRAVIAKSKTPETIEKIRQANIGKKVSEQTRALMSRNRKLRPPASAEHRKNLSEAGKGRVFSEESRAKITEGLRRYHASKKK